MSKTNCNNVQGMFTTYLHFRKTFRVCALRVSRWCELSVFYHRSLQCAVCSIQGLFRYVDKVMSEQNWNAVSGMCTMYALQKVSIYVLCWVALHLMFWYTGSIARECYSFIVCALTLRTCWNCYTRSTVLHQLCAWIVLLGEGRCVAFSCWTSVRCR